MMSALEYLKENIGLENYVNVSGVSDVTDINMDDNEAFSSVKYIAHVETSIFK